jgi:hypothetical protein
MAADSPFDGVSFTFQLSHIFSEILKCFAFVSQITFESLLKSPGALYDFFRMLLKTFKW